MGSEMCIRDSTSLNAPPTPPLPFFPPLLPTFPPYRVPGLLGGKVNEALPLADAMLERIGTWNRRTLDQFAERAYFYASWAYEKAGKIEGIRARLLAAQRTACLHHNVACQATLLNLLLRSYQSAKLFVQADKLLAKSNFPETASNAQVGHRRPIFLGQCHMGCVGPLLTASAYVPSRLTSAARAIPVLQWADQGAPA